MSGNKDISSIGTIFNLEPLVHRFIFPNKKVSYMKFCILVHTAAKYIKAPPSKPRIDQAIFFARANMLKWVLELKSEEEATKLLHEFY